jgi:hypothetical protein
MSGQSCEFVKRLNMIGWVISLFRCLLPGLSVFAIDALYRMQPRKDWISRMWTRISWMFDWKTKVNSIIIVLDYKTVVQT